MKLVITTDQWNDLEAEHGEHMLDAYSGRGMYGDTCLAYTGPKPTLFAFDLARLLAQDGDWVLGDVDDIRQQLAEVVGEPLIDSMGLGTIVHYWPRLVVADGSKPDDD